jgi:hypothetical protein
VIPPAMAVGFTNSSSSPNSLSSLNLILVSACVVLAVLLARGGPR